MSKHTTIGALVFAGTVWDAWHYLGVGGIVAAALWGAAASVLVVAIANRLNRRQAARLTLALGVIGLAAFAFLYPRLDVHEPLKGSDRDDDDDVAVIAAWHGRYPFDERTYLGNPVTHLPGTLLVSAPFVAAGGSALENLVVLPLGVLVLARRTKSAEALAVPVLGLATCTGAWHELVVGGNTLAEWALLSLGAVWLAAGVRRWPRVLAFGAALNVRTNALTAGLAPVGVTARRDVARAAAVAVIVGLVQVVLVGPFLLGGVGRFSPLSGGSGKFAHLDELFPHASSVVPAVAVAAGAAAAFEIGRRLGRPLVGVLYGLAASQLAQFGVLLVASLAAGSTYWAENWTQYFVLATIPGLAAVGLTAEERVTA